eukprot:m.66861 g.66861  ORF g.66861 m.66861 type:complete len:286 (-) comp12671_c0_seq1:35-892(-)
MQPRTCSSHACRVHTVRKNTVPSFAPALPDAAIFGPDAIASGEFRNFIIAKAINAEHSSCNSGFLHQLRERTRHTLLHNFVEEYMSVVPLVQRSGKRGKTRRVANPRQDFLGKLTPTMTWTCRASSGPLLVLLAPPALHVIDNNRLTHLHSIPLVSILGWSLDTTGIDIFHGRYESQLHLRCTAEQVAEISTHLGRVCAGSIMVELVLKREDSKQPWGFALLGNRIVSITPGSVASQVGLQQGQRLFRVAGKSVRGLQTDEIVSLVQRSALALRPCPSSSPEEAL